MKDQKSQRNPDSKIKDLGGKKTFKAGHKNVVMAGPQLGVTRERLGTASVGAGHRGLHGVQRGFII